MLVKRVIYMGPLGCGNVAKVVSKAATLELDATASLEAIVEAILRHISG